MYNLATITLTQVYFHLIVLILKHIQNAHLKSVLQIMSSQVQLCKYTNLTILNAIF